MIKDKTDEWDDNHPKPIHSALSASEGRLRHELEHHEPTMYDYTKPGNPIMTEDEKIAILWALFLAALAAGLTYGTWQ